MIADVNPELYLAYQRFAHFKGDRRNHPILYVL